MTYPTITGAEWKEMLPKMYVWCAGRLVLGENRQISALQICLCI